MPHFDSHGRDTWLCQHCAKVFSSDTQSVWTKRGNACPTCAKAYVTQVFDRLPDIDNAKFIDRVSVERGIMQLFMRGFTLDDAYEFTRWTEEVNPHVSEDRALARINAVSQKYGSMK